MNEKDYEAGRSAAYHRIMRICLSEVGMADFNFVRLGLERAETVAKLRELCALIGDNDWPDNLYLPDVIEKHIIRHIENQT